MVERTVLYPTVVNGISHSPDLTLTDNLTEHIICKRSRRRKRRRRRRRRKRRRRRRMRKKKRNDIGEKGRHTKKHHTYCTTAILTAYM